MKILLAKPYNRSDHIQPSLGLGYLAAAVRKKHEVKLLDCIKDKVDAVRFAEILSEYRPDVLGLQCYTFDIGFIDSVLKSAKALNRKMVTMIGGPHPTAAPEETMKNFGESLDLCFVGEAETGLPMLLDLLSEGESDLGGVPGLVWRKDGSIKKNARIFQEDLDIIPMPAWDLIRPETYPEAQHGAFFKQFPIAPVIVTRGCPFPCTFCAGGVVAGKKIRRRSIDNVINELIYLNKERGIREFHIIDDNFTMDMNYAKKFLRRLKELDLGMTWAVPNGVRMDALDEELLELMKQTGLYMISLGIESGSDEVLGNMKKHLTTSRIRECVKRINKAGIDVSGFFIMGFPGETVETMFQTIKFSRELGLVRANFFTYLPFPGTESYEVLRAGGETGGVDWEHFYFMNASYVPKGLTRKKLKNMQRLAFAGFYLRPRIILYNLRSIKSFRHLVFLAKRFLNWIVLG